MKVLEKILYILVLSEVHSGTIYPIRAAHSPNVAYTDSIKINVLNPIRAALSP